MVSEMHDEMAKITETRSLQNENNIKVLAGNQKHMIEDIKNLTNRLILAETNIDDLNKKLSKLEAKSSK